MFVKSMTVRGWKFIEFGESIRSRLTQTQNSQKMCGPNICRQQIAFGTGRIDLKINTETVAKTKPLSTKEINAFFW